MESTGAKVGDRWLANARHNAKRIDHRNAAAIALLQSWIKEDATNDPEKIAEAEAEVTEFKRNMNTNRAENGERLLFP